MAPELKKIISLYLFIAFYGIAGIMHFVIPRIYIAVIPEQLGDPIILNYAAGIVELSAALLVLFYKSRKIAGYLTIAMLLCFVISHLYFIELGSCAMDYCIPAWISWTRSIFIHPLLIYWAWKISQMDIAVS